ncbi:MAG TPA: 2-oxo-4-hydroxy-4-carboxy-5-ureidoimidazoline decarboxylase [Patescibacteria group bacterium]|nr:2-oxo-4-hydroxy-4-carboxy-5-ureidoimidazoline decarboxylase [Patescibacteria group bacterium]
MDDKPLTVRPRDVALDVFLRVYGGIYEHSPWIAEAAYKNALPVATVAELHAAMVTAVAAGTVEQKLALIRAHPDLAPAIGTALTDASVSEQKSAGLKECTAEEFAEFQRLNKVYKEKFGFPFIVAVKGLNRHDILERFRARMGNTPDAEFATALAQIDRIAFFRLMALP